MRQIPKLEELIAKGHMKKMTGMETVLHNFFFVGWGGDETRSNVVVSKQVHW
jgi:hypothetical protein